MTGDPDMVENGPESDPAAVERAGAGDLVQRDADTAGDLAPPDSGTHMERIGPSPLQVVKGASGLGLLWGGGWALLNAVLVSGLAVFGSLPWAMVVPGAIRFGLWGFLCGAAFALVLTTMERKHSVEELSLVRVGLWGATGGFLVVFSIMMMTGLLGALGLETAILQSLQGGVLGAMSAAATTWMAKSAPDEG
jgi:hypothetical protein